MAKCKPFFLALITLLTIYNSVAAQDHKKTLEARITFFDEVITDKKHEGEYAYKGLALTFINNSDQDIFIPYFIPIIRNKYNPSRGLDLFFTYYKKDSLGYKEVLKPERKDTPGELSNDIAGLGQLMAPFSYRTKIMNDKLKLEIMKTVNNKRVNELLNDLFTMPIFLKAHQEWEYYLPTMWSSYALLGSYKISFEPLLSRPVKDEFPEVIMGYKKFYPTEIKCAPLFVHFEPLRREESESILEQVKKMRPDVQALVHF